MFWVGNYRPIWLFGREIHRRSYPHDELIDEQSLAYVSSILRLFAAKDNIDDGEDQHRSGVSWPLLTEALYKRGSYERRSLSRTERTIRQLEELTAQFTSKIPAANDRGIKYFFWSRMPSYWQIEVRLLEISRINKDCLAFSRSYSYEDRFNKKCFGYILALGTVGWNHRLLHFSWKTWPSEWFSCLFYTGQLNLFSGRKSNSWAHCKWPRDTGTLLLPWGCNF